MQAGAESLELLYETMHGLQMGSDAQHVGEPPIRGLKAIVTNGTNQCS